MDTIIWGAVLRLLQTLSVSAPTLLIGFFVAAVLQQMTGPERTRRLFGDGRWSSIPIAWLIGMSLPVCSLGCLPILYYLRRAGVTSGAILAFAISAPLFNPISVLWGLTLSDPVVILTFCLLSLLIVSAVGIVVDRFSARLPMQAEPANPAFGLKRVLSVAIGMCRLLYSRTTFYLLLGVVGVSWLSLLLPKGYLQSSAERGDPFAPVFMGLVALPAYETPLTAIVKLGDMFQHGNSVGAALTLLVLGAGMNLGLLVWAWVHFGWRPTFAFMGTLLIVSITAAYLIDRPLTPTGVDAAGHTHAFDVYCNPFPAGMAVNGQEVVDQWLEGTSSYELVALDTLLVLLTVGGLLRATRLADPVLAWTREGNVLKYDQELSGRTLGILSGMGLLIGSIFSCYLFYPPRQEILEEMRLVNGELGAAGTSQSWETIEYWLPVQESWSRKLEVSMYLRGQEFGPYERAKLSLLRDKLDLLRHAAEDRDKEAAHQASMAMTRAYSRMRSTVLPDSDQWYAGIPEGGP